MLLTQKVKIRWNPRNKNEYISKGYIFTKMNDEFEINCSDLSEGNHAFVDVQCDCCDKILEDVIWQAYMRNRKDDNKYYCKNCAMKLYGGDNLQKSLLKKNGKSFEQWCIENDRLDVLNRWDYELNDKKPNEVSYGSEGKNRKGYWFKCLIGIHESELKRISSFVTGRQCLDCELCNSFAQWGIDNLGEDFLDKYWDWELNNELGISPWAISKFNNKKVYVKCQNKEYHGSYPICPYDFANKGLRCPYCTNRCGKVHYLDSLGTLCPHTISVWSKLNNKSPYEYAPRSREDVYWKCENEKHEDYNRAIGTSYNCDFRCPYCVEERDESFLQEKVRVYLENLNYTVLHENRCNIMAINPKKKGANYTMPYDNEVVELKLIIEVNGIQHYKISEFHYKNARKSTTTPEYELYMQKVRDRYKRIYAKSQGYNYLEIPYYTNDKKDTYKTLIDNKIKEILNNQAS